MSPPKQSRNEKNRVAIIQAVQKPLGFFVLVVLVLEVTFGIVANLKAEPVRTYAIVGMILLMFFVVGWVGFLAYKGRLTHMSDKRGEVHPRFELLVGGPEEMPDLDIMSVEWDDDECFMIGSDLKEHVKLVPARIGPSFHVHIPEHVFHKLQQNSPVELRLKDSKGHTWKVKSFFIFQNFLRLSLGEDPSTILKEYGGSDVG
jgi:hypothetical protein